MKSPFTGKEMKLVREQRTMQFRKENFEYVHHAYRCEGTEEQFTTTELDELNIFQVYNQYREKHSIPFPEEIKAVREKYGVSATKMSEILGFGTNSYRLYEDGEVPQTSNARLIQSVSNPSNFKSMVELCDELDQKSKTKIIARVDELIQAESIIYPKKIITGMLIGDLKPEQLTGFVVPKLDKLQEMVVYFSEKLKPYKTKLNKLLFYADFYNFKQTGYSISGCRYRAIDNGPVINNFQAVFNYMEKIEIQTQVFDGDKTGEQFVLKENIQFDSSLFTALELQSLQDVAEAFGNMKTLKLIDKSHEELAWIEPFKTKALISYTYAFQLKHI